MKREGTTPDTSAEREPLKAGEMVAEGASVPEDVGPAGDVARETAHAPSIAVSSEAEVPAAELAAEAEGAVPGAEGSEAEVPAAEPTAEPEGAAPGAEPSGAEAPAEEMAAPDQRAWFVIHTYSGYENKVRKNLEHRIESMGMREQIFQVIVPTEEEVEIKGGHRRTVERRLFPGYVLVQMLLNDESWSVVRNTPGVTGFVSSGNRPVPLQKEEVDKIVKRMEAEAPTVKVGFRVGQKVRIVSGPFVDFMGTVDELNAEKGKVRVLVAFFGRETPIELDFLQVEKQ